MTLHVEPQTLPRSAPLDPPLRRLLGAIGAPPLPFSLELPDGRCAEIGEGAPRFHVRIRSRRGLRRVLSLDEGRIAEAYMAGELDVEGDLLSAMALRDSFGDRHYLSLAWRFLQPLVFGQIGANRRAIRHHYDLGEEFYLSFLDETRCYTQGIFLRDDEPLREAIHRKFDTCIGDCRLEPGSRLLEVGPGWGAFSEYVAERGVRVTGVTNSAKSLDFMEALGARRGFDWEMVLGDILEFRSERRFDAIVLMGIMEHLPDYPRVLAKFSELLVPGGRVYLDASASRVKYTSSSFVYREIYPANHSFFELSDFLAAVARSPFQLRSVHDDRHSYFLTFRHWAEKWESRRERVVEAFGERDFRRFRLYLWASAHRFETDGLQCYRVVLESPA